MQEFWGGHRGQMQGLRHEDIQISFRKNQAASLVSRSFGSPLPGLVCFSSNLIRVGCTVTVFRILAMSNLKLSIVGSWSTVSCHGCSFGIKTWSHLKVTLFAVRVKT